MKSGKQIFGANVRRLRMARGWTQERLAEQSDLSLRYIQWLEAGKKFPRVEALQKLRHGLGCEWNDLLARL
ncbi:MAG: helix-turn-helix domain-containing protein [Verrucomicrobiales bacterium]|nr:helix-turn-helix domain-containing protein [Verrucomicrobiales bacterium]